MTAYVFHATLVGLRGVTRTLAVRREQTFDDVHRALQDAFGWDDDHLYAFWTTGRFWDREGGYFAPFGLEPGERSTEERLDGAGLAVGQKLAYVFDFGDEWRVRLALRKVVDVDGGGYPRLLAARGEAPPQYQRDQEVVEVE
jgi:hypothetical protein